MAILHKVSATACEDPQRKADVVFIHGLGGDASGTWRYGEDDKTSWPHWLADEFKQVGVWSLGYAASPTKWAGLLDTLQFWKSSNRDAGQSMSLPDRAGQVLSRMREDLAGERPIIFVCHSLGGLLTKQILRKSADHPKPELQAIAQRTKAVLFLATPHNGAALATMLSRFSAIFGATVSMRGLQAHDPHLRDLYNWYRSHAQRLQIESVTYFEGRDVRGFRIVDETSSQPGVGDEPVMLDEDHLSIAKPRSADADVCRALSRLVRSCVQAPGSSPTTPPSASPPPVGPPAGSPIHAPLLAQADALAGAQTHVHVHVHTGADAGEQANTDTRDGATDRPREIPCQLPLAAHKFFGRADALQTLIGRLRDGRTTTVIADAGMGKTALAAEALRLLLGAANPAQVRAALAGTQFPDGIVFLDLYLHHGQADQAWTDIANALSDSEFLKTEPAQTRAKQACAGKRFLLIVEGGEEARGGEDDGFARSTRRALLDPLALQGPMLWLTRRIDQSSPPEEIRLDQPLGDDDARALFDDLSAGRVAAEWRDQALALLGGHPLAITWAAALLARNDEPPQYLLDDLRQPAGGNLRDPEDARHTLHWLFQRSLRGLDDAARRSLFAAGLLAAEPFPLAAIAVGTGLDDCAQREALAACVRTSLLRLDHADPAPGDAARVMPQWRFGHALGYGFARSAAEADGDTRAVLLSGLAQWAHDDLVACQTAEAAVHTAPQAQRSLQHAIALLRADAAMGLWWPLAYPLLYDIGDRFVALGQLTSALSALQAVEAWLASLPAAEADATQWQREVSASHNRLGALLQAQGDLPGAQRRFEASRTIFERLAAQDPANAEWQRDLSVSHNKLGDLLQAQGDLTGAQRRFEACLHISERLAAQDPANAEWQRDLSISYDRLGNLLLTQGDPPGAQQRFEASLHIRERLAAQDPANAQWQRDLSVSYEKLGDLLQAQGDLPGAQRRFEACLHIRERLAAQDPANAQWQRDLAVSHFKLAGLSEAQGDMPGELARLQQARVVFSALVQRAPDHPQYQRELAMVEQMIAAINGSPSVP